MIATSTRRAVPLSVPAFAEINPDAELLALGRKQEAVHARLKATEILMNKAKFTACNDEIWEIARRIFAMPAHTAPGLMVKVCAVELCAMDHGAVLAVPGYPSP